MSPVTNITRAWGHMSQDLGQVRVVSNNKLIRKICLHKLVVKINIEDCKGYIQP